MKPSEVKSQWEKEPSLELAKRYMPSLIKLACLAEEIQTQYKISVFGTLSRKNEYGKQAKDILKEFEGA